MDKGTEIGPSDLFDFNHEVRPLLDILVARTLEIAMAEIVEEDELASLRRRQVRGRIILRAFVSGFLHWRPFHEVLFCCKIENRVLA